MEKCRRTNYKQFISIYFFRHRQACCRLFFLTTFALLYFYISTPIANAQAGVALPNPLGDTNVGRIIGNIITMLIGGAGSIALFMFIYGGFLWLTSAGNAEKIKKGQAIILWSVLGMVVMFSAYIIVRYVLGGILGAAGVEYKF